jgi:hypothetical protein
VSKVVEMANYEVRTQIYLEQEQHEALKQLASEKAVSMAQLIRDAVAAYIVQEKGEQEEFDLEAYLNDPLWQIPGLADELGPSGLTDASVNHDHYIYELDKPYRAGNPDE